MREGVNLHTRSTYLKKYIVLLYFIFIVNLIFVEYF
jgi:hypothetical protein